MYLSDKSNAEIEIQFNGGINYDYDTDWMGIMVARCMQSHHADFAHTYTDITQTNHVKSSNNHRLYVLRLQITMEISAFIHSPILIEYGLEYGYDLFGNKIN